MVTESWREGLGREKGLGEGRKAETSPFQGEVEMSEGGQGPGLSTNFLSSMDCYSSDPNLGNNKSQSPGYLSAPGENLKMWASLMAMGTLRSISAP